MQKKIIALAIAAAASSAAFAQSNVTLYGIADVGFANTKADNNASTNAGHSTNGINSGLLSTSRIGFKGAEDLGNGLKAIFTLEYALALDANQNIGYSSTANSSARQQFVGLSSDKFGTVVGGHLQTVGLDFTVAATALSGSTTLGAINQSAVKLGGGVGMIQAAGRAQNAVAYVSPTWNGLSFAYNYSANAGTLKDGKFDTTTATNSASEAWGKNLSANLVGLNYANGPITAGAVYSKINVPGTANLDVQEWGLRAGYDFQVVKLNAAFQSYKNEAVSQEKDTKWAVSAAVPVTAQGTIVAEYAKAKVKSAADADGKAYTLAYTHALSKRTTGYAGYVVSNPEGSDNSTKTFGLGVRHAF